MKINTDISLTQICRTCLEEIENTARLCYFDYRQDKSELTTGQKLNNCIPEIDLGITVQRVICQNCSDAINAMHEFKMKCLRTETQLDKYSQQIYRASEQIDLAEVTQFYKLQQDIPMEIKSEAVYIKEEFKNEEVTVNLDLEEIDRESIDVDYLSLPEKDNIRDSQFKKDETCVSSSTSDIALTKFMNDHTYSQKTNLENCFETVDTFGHRSKKHYKYSHSKHQSNHKSHLDTYMQNDTKQKSFSCLHCEFRSKRKSRLKIHMRIHTGEEKPFKCEHCEFRTDWKWSLKFHMRIHTGEKAFKCEYCEYGSNRKNSLKTHIQIHTGEKAFKCSQCDYRTSWKCNLKNHIFSHTSKKHYKCSHCKYQTNMKNNLKSHMLIHTG